MRSVSDTIARLHRLRPVVEGDGDPTTGSSLTELRAFGSNPGALRGFCHVPRDLAPASPLVVVLHGCTQTAAGYHHGSGWGELAEEFGFAVLLPEQQRGNNPNLCFNWFSPEDTRRGGGEVESIRQMIDAVVRRDGIDPSRIFVTGLSAGGAMASTMLAVHPELFAGGAIVAGLPHGVAATMPEAFDRMRGHGYRASLLGPLARAASDHRGSWPSVSVWHGTADGTVDAVNAAMIVEQWRGLHDVTDPDIVDRGAGYQHRIWHDRDGRAVIEEYAIAGMGHGTPLASSGNEACGVAGPYLLDVGISSTYRIAAAWGIAPARAPARTRSVAEPSRSFPASLASGPTFDPTQTINGALRAAGLIKS